MTPTPHDTLLMDRGLYPGVELGPTSPTPLSWADAMAWCKELGDGWRAPTLPELAGVYDYDAGQPRGDGWASNYYWSASTYQFYPPYAWYVYFYDGFVGAGSKTDNGYVRAVWGGKP